MSHNASPHHNSQQNTPPEDIFPVFQYNNPPTPTPPEVMFPPPNNQPPEDIFPVFQYNNPPTPTPPEVMFPPAIQPPQYHPPAIQLPHYHPPAIQPPQYHPPAIHPPENDMEYFLRFEAAEADERRAREEYLRGKQARRNARRAYRMAHGLDYVATSDDDSSDSSHEGFVSDDSFN